jgi:hypothetical protein
MGAEVIAQSGLTTADRVIDSPSDALNDGGSSPGHGHARPVSGGPESAPQHNSPENCRINMLQCSI